MTQTDKRPHQEARPNLLFIFADQLGAAYTGCYGHPQVHTPNLDRLAGESVLFENAYTAAPLCTPFRGTLFTGRYPMQTGVWENSQRLPGTEDTLADHFNRSGYTTGYAGKWHLAGPPRKTWVPPMERAGFRDFVGWDCGHVRHINQKYFDGDSPEEFILEGHETDGLTDIVCDRLERLAASDGPFCSFVSYQAPHPFCDPPAEYLDMYRGQPLSFRKTVDTDACFRGYGADTARMGVTEWTERYFGEITHLDHAVGRLLEKIETLGLRDNTIIVFTADHGDMGGCRGMFEKAVPYEEATRIPLLVRLPGREPARRTDALFSSIDFMPTLIGLCGLSPAETAEGVNAASLIRGAADAPRREHLIMQLKDWCCIRKGDIKLTMSREDTAPRELYRLGRDPFEEMNLVNRPEERNTVAELTEAYVTWHRDAATRIGDVAEASMISPALRS